MSTPAGRIELERTVDSITVGRRHRTDLGDLDALAASIERDGLLQPPTITPDGTLVCGARRLAAIKQLGHRRVSVWVRSGISDRLGHLLAEQDDNQLHKALSPIEAAGLYREIKELMAEDAARRKAATQFQDGHEPGEHGPADSAGPPAPGQLGDARAQAARMVTGSSSYTRLEQIGFLQHLTNDPATPEALRAQARDGLAQIEAGAPVNPIFQRLRDAHTEAGINRDRRLHELADEALARVHATKRGKATKPAAPSRRPGRRGRGAGAVLGARVRADLGRAGNVVDALRRGRAGRRPHRRADRGVLRRRRGHGRVRRPAPHRPRRRTAGPAAAARPLNHRPTPRVAGGLTSRL